MLFKAKNMFRYAPEGGNGGGNPGDSTPPTGGDPRPGEAVVTMPQAQLDKLMAERGEQGKRALLKEFGVETPEEIKTILAKAKEIEDAQKTEQERLAEEAGKHKTRAEKAEQERNDAVSRLNETLKRTFVLLAAKDFNDPEDAWRFIDREQISVKEDGTVEGVDKAVEALTKSKPYLLKAAQDKRPGSPAGPGQRTTVQKPGEKPTETRKPIVHL